MTHDEFTAITEQLIKDMVGVDKPSTTCNPEVAVAMMVLSDYIMFGDYEQFAKAVGK